jgi:hypothetical protein
MRPPIRFDVSQKTVLGITYRTIVIMAIAICVAIASVGNLRTLPLFVRAGLAVLSVGLGLALSYGQINGKTPEAWLWDLLTFRRRSRFLLHRAARIHAEGQVGWAPEDQAPEASAPPIAAASAAVPAAPNFFVLSANAIGWSILTGLTVWLIQGGAQELSAMLKRF